MKKILVAEDEASIREFLVINLVRAGYEVVQAGDGAEAIEAYESSNGDFVVAILDIMMPNVDGLEVCKYLRSKSDNIGIIMLTAKSQENDKVTGFLSGADDYITKPFSTSELVARVDAVYRRVEMMNIHGESPSDDVITRDVFVLNRRSRTLTKSGAYIELTQVEFQMMDYFFSNSGIALSRLDILNTVWGSDYFGDEKIVDVNVRRLRMKIEDNPSSPDHIVTVWGIGYKWI